MKEKIKALLRLRKEEKTSRAFKKWKTDREEFTHKCREGNSPDASALANVLEGLTPDGYDKNGRKVSFFERGKDVFEEGEPLIRISPSGGRQDFEIKKR